MMIKSPSPYRHTLEDGADATTELVSGKSSGLIGGMRQEKANLSDERIDNKQEEVCENCLCWYPTFDSWGECTCRDFDSRKTDSCSFFDRKPSCEQTQGHKRIS